MAGEGHTGHDALRPHRARAAAHERLQVDALGCVDGIGTHTINHHKYNHAIPPCVQSLRRPMQSSLSMNNGTLPHILAFWNEAYQ